MIPVYSHPQFPPEDSQVITNKLSMTKEFYYFLRSLFLRTGGPTGVGATVGANLTASGTTQATALELADDFNEVLNGAGGVQIPALQPAQSMIVFNGLSGNLNVYPQFGGQIDALAVNSPYVLANGKSQEFWCAKLLASGAPLMRSVQLG